MSVLPDTYTRTIVPARDATPLALHCWTPPGGVGLLGVLFYVHGIQSHAGWLFETGPELAARGVVTCVLDRRGSGQSGGHRGDLPTADIVVSDYRLGLAAVRLRFPGLAVTALGQSFGASVLAAAAVGGLTADQLVYCTPALGQQLARHGPARAAEIAQLDGLGYSAIALVDEDYTDDRRYLEFMANDHLMLRQLTDRSRATMVELERRYVESSIDTGVPVHLVRVEHDPIIDLDTAAVVAARLHGPVRITTLSARRHYVEFSPYRRDYWDWICGVISDLGTTR